MRSRESFRSCSGHIIQTAGRPGPVTCGFPQLLIPIYGITWNRRISGMVTTDRINKLMRLMRNLGLKQSGYDRLSDFPQRAYATSPVFPPELLEWQILAGRFRLDEPHEWASVLASVTFLAGRGFSSPKQLADIAPAGLETLCGASDFAAITRQLWGVARATFAPATSSSSLCLVTPEQQADGLALTRAFKKHPSQFARPGKLNIHMSKKLKQKRPFQHLGPMREIAQLKKARLPPTLIERFCEDATRTNLLKQVRGSLPGLTSAFR